jgi:hypothetical protein
MKANDEEIQITLQKEKLRRLRNVLAASGKKKKIGWPERLQPAKLEKNRPLSAKILYY